MTKGTILRWKKFTFNDGDTSQHDKFLIVLNSPTEPAKTPYLLCKATSDQKRRYPVKSGCNTNPYVYMLNANEDYFNKPTWIQFDDFYIKPANELLVEKLTLRKIDVVHTLSDATIRAIIICAKKSQDISNYQLTLL